MFDPLHNLRRHPVRLIGLFLLLTLVASLILTQAAVTARKEAIQALSQRASSDLNRYMLTLQQKLKRYQNLPALLAQQSQLLHLISMPDDGVVQHAANRYLERVRVTIDASDVYLMGANGETLAASNWNSERSFVGRNFSFRPYFSDAMAGIPGRYFALGTTSNKRGYFFSYPVWQNEQVIGVVVVKIDLNDIENDWNDPLRDILVMDEDGIIFISTRPDWKFRALSNLTDDVRSRITTSQRYGDASLSSLEVTERRVLTSGNRLITLEDRNSNRRVVKPQQYLVQTEALSGTGLHVAILSSMEPVESNTRDSVMFAGVGLLAALLGALVVLNRQRLNRERNEFRVRQTQTLEESAARIRAIIDSTCAGLITLDLTGRIRSVNPIAAKLFGAQESELRGQYFSRLMVEEVRYRFWAFINSEVQRQELFMETSARCLDGRRISIELIFGELRVATRPGFLVTIHDITERKGYENALKAAQEELEQRVAERTEDLTHANAQLTAEVASHRDTQNELIQTAKLAILGQISAGINHELNQPLAAIRAYADNARVFLQRGRMEPVDSNLEQIGQLTERMAKIIHPLKEFARKSSGNPEPVCLQVVCDGARSILYGRLHKESVEICWPAEMDRIYVMADTVRLEQVLVNLIGNALQAMDNAPAKKVELAVEPVAEGWSIQVRDHGPGIPAGDTERVFEPFYTTKKSGEGLGLGLSISQRIVTNLGGTLTVANHPEGGAQFTLWLPKAPNPSKREQVL